MEKFLPNLFSKPNVETKTFIDVKGIMPIDWRSLHGKKLAISTMEYMGNFLVIGSDTSGNCYIIHEEIL